MESKGSKGSFAFFHLRLCFAAAIGYRYNCDSLELHVWIAVTAVKYRREGDGLTFECNYAAKNKRQKTSHLTHWATFSTTGTEHFFLCLGRNAIADRTCTLVVFYSRRPRAL